MQTRATYYLVTPFSVWHSRTVPGALAQARRCERWAQSEHGPGAGADCYIVTARGGSLAYRGHCCGRRIIGPTWGVGACVVEQVVSAIAAGTVRED